MKSDEKLSCLTNFLKQRSSFTLLYMASIDCTFCSIFSGFLGQSGSGRPIGLPKLISKRSRGFYKLL